MLLLRASWILTIWVSTGGINGPVFGGSDTGSSHAQGSHVDELAWVDERAQQHLEIYQRLVIEEYGKNHDNHPLLDERLWLKPAGGKKKGRTYCANKSSDPFFVLTGMVDHRFTSKRG